MPSSYAGLAQRGLRSELERTGGVLVNASRAILRRETRNYSGNTSKKLYADVSGQNGSLRMAYGTRARHGIVVHEGRRAGKAPPWQRIERWVRYKLRVAAEEVRRVTYAVRWKIARTGTEGTPFLRKPFDRVKKQLAGRLAGAAVRELNSNV